jgi:3-deoxy-D-manno-octulosonic-acid transferase
MIGGRDVVVAVSTHAGEEALVVAAAKSTGRDPLVVIAPRHPQRGAEVAALLAAHGVARRSVGEPIGPETGVYLADTLGELGLVMRLAPFAVVGGGFDAAVGGHNPLEPARLGVGVVSGPHVANHADVFAEMVAASAAVLTPDEAALAAELSALLGDADRRAALAGAAAAYAARQESQLGAALEQIRPLLPAA